MTDKHDIKNNVGKLIRINKTEVPSLSKEEKERLKQSIQTAIKQVLHENT